MPCREVLWPSWNTQRESSSTLISATGLSSQSQGLMLMSYDIQMVQGTGSMGPAGTIVVDSCCSSSFYVAPVQTNVRRRWVMGFFMGRSSLARDHTEEEVRGAESAWSQVDVCCSLHGFPSFLSWLKKKSHSLEVSTCAHTHLGKKQNKHYM